MQDQDHVYKTKIKTSIYVLEEPRDQDHGLEDYNTAAFKLLPELQSAYRAHHSPETAVLGCLAAFCEQSCFTNNVGPVSGLRHRRPCDFTSASEYILRPTRFYSLTGSRLILMIAHNPSSAALPLLPLVLCCAASFRVRFLDRSSFFSIPQIFCN